MNLLNIIFFSIPIIILLILIGIITVKKRGKSNKTHFLLLAFLFIVIVGYFVLLKTGVIQPAFNIYNNFDSSNISDFLAIIAIIVDIIIAIIENFEKLRIRFDYLELSHKSLNATSNSSSITATIIQSDNDSFRDNTIIQIQDATLYIVVIKDIFKNPTLFKQLKDNSKFCKKIDISNILTDEIPIINPLGKPQFSFEIIDENSLFDGIIDPSISNYEDRKMLVLGMKYSFHHKNRLLNRIFKKLFFKQTNKKNIAYTFFEFERFENGKYIFKTCA